MSTAVRPDSRTEAVEWPRLESCGGCGQEVVVARMERPRSIVVLEPWPVIVGVGRCAYCKGKGERTVPEYARGGLRDAPHTMGDLEGKMTRGTKTSCPVCGGTGKRGEKLTSEHVVMRIDGVCRRAHRLIARWDSAYRRHQCPTLE